VDSKQARKEYVHQTNVIVKSVKRGKEWWITGVPESEDCGPYDTKAEAEEDRIGLERTERWGHLHHFYTSDMKATKRKAPVETPKKPPKKTAKRKTAKRKKRVAK